MVALSLISKGTVKQKLALAFDLYDSNGDGVLTYNEILEVVKVCDINIALCAIFHGGFRLIITVH